MSDFIKGCSTIFQWGIYWAQMDKRRPVVIISSNWYNITAQTAIVAPITSSLKGPTSGKYYAELYIPVLNFNYRNFSKELPEEFPESNSDTILTYIDMSSIRSLNLSNSNYKKKLTKGFIAMLTDVEAKGKICTIMNQIMLDDFNMERFTYSAQIQNRFDIESIRMKDDVVQQTTVEEPVVQPTPKVSIQKVSEPISSSTGATKRDSGIGYKYPMRKNVFKRIYSNINEDDLVQELSKILNLSLDNESNETIIKALASMIKLQNTHTDFSSSKEQGEFINKLLEHSKMNQLISATLFKQIKSYMETAPDKPFDQY